MRVQIPRDPVLRLKLAANVYKKHSDDAAASPLDELQDHNWNDNGPKIEEAQKLQTEIEQLEKSLEVLYGQHDLLILPILETVKSSRDLLMGVYAANPKKSGEWGFTVGDSAKAVKEKPADVK